MEQIEKSKFLALVASKKKMKSESASLSSAHGEEVKEAVENLNLNAAAFKDACKVNEMSEGKRDDYIRSLLVYFEYLDVMPGEDLVDMAESGEPRTSSETKQNIHVVN